MVERCQRALCWQLAVIFDFAMSAFADCELGVLCCYVQGLTRFSQLAARIGVSTAKKRKNASPVKGRARKSQRSEDQVAFHLA
jgi:hypothetical protein